ncbi:MAG TPA: hypothetical protein VK507_05225, partial [Iamia sp.]|nr:hypothetical protein [Iamia sp.]
MFTVQTDRRRRRLVPTRGRQVIGVAVAVVVLASGCSSSSSPESSSASDPGPTTTEDVADVTPGG